MEKLGLNELRERFLSFFEKKGHLRMPSFPLLPQGDNSLLLVNSGMAPLKPYFTGEVTPPNKRVTTCQKCIRTPDIERVGKTSRHGTYFEMLGDFSFEDYFKREACAWAWEFVVGEMSIPVDKLYITVYLDDDEAHDIWVNEVGVAPDRVSRLGKADNFWEIGQGPCGPCSEIYFDRGEARGCGEAACAPGCDCDRFVEFWNLVFTQFYNDGENNYTELEHKNIDTGMGLERLACIMQDVESLFDVDTVRAITAHISKLTGVPYGKSEGQDVSLRVITDHIRSTTMMICDGVLPSNEGRGYVLRRLLRRAARHGKLLGRNTPFLHEVADTVIAESTAAYPELSEKQDYIKKIIQVEEENFAKTIDAGMRIFDEMLAALGEGSTLSGDDAFKLYDTYGFPIDLTVEILEEQGKTVDRTQFDALMQEQRERARAATAALGDFGWEGLDLGLDRDVETVFVGYDHLQAEGEVLAIVVGGTLSDTAKADDTATIVLDTTPFYAEAGGQVADFGYLSAGDFVFRVEDVQKTKDGKIMHKGVVEAGQVSKGTKVTAAVDAPRRMAVMRAHSAAHLLHRALKNVLGTHVEQAGSFVGPDTVRFDFTHFQAMTPDELVMVDREINEMILADLIINNQEMTMDDAKAAGAVALFGEKYGDTVRVLTMGDYSTELCGGTHLTNTAKIGPFRLTSEFSIASGVRRVEAVTGAAALTYFHDVQRMLNEAVAALKTSPGELMAKIGQMQNEMKGMRKELQTLSRGQIKEEAAKLIEGAVQTADLRLVALRLKDTDSDYLRGMGDALKSQGEDVVAVLCGENEGKITFLAVCGKAAIAKGVKAGDIIKHVTALTGGSGGGRPDNAMGGGKDAGKIDEALSSMAAFVQEKLGG
ncbi:MAG: alanine--tRNA ligase [Oscillospiraceae bacterium]|nr:alanine--tRNA ligase [Oscillospiraceae bacterium]